MFPNALQIEGIKFHMMDNATYLSFMHMIDNHGQANATMQTKMGQFWTDCHHRAAERSAITLAVAAALSCRARVEKDRTSWGDDFLSPASRK